MSNPTNDPNWAPTHPDTQSDLARVTKILEEWNKTHPTPMVHMRAEQYAQMEQAWRDMQEVKGLLTRVNVLLEMSGTTAVYDPQYGEKARSVREEIARWLK